MKDQPSNPYKLAYSIREACAASSLCRTTVYAPQTPDSSRITTSKTVHTDQLGFGCDVTAPPWEAIYG